MSHSKKVKVVVYFIFIFNFFFSIQSISQVSGIGEIESEMLNLLLSDRATFEKKLEIKEKLIEVYSKIKLVNIKGINGTLLDILELDEFLSRLLFLEYGTINEFEINEEFENELTLKFIIPKNALSKDTKTIKGKKKFRLDFSLENINIALQASLFKSEMSTNDDLVESWRNNLGFDIGLTTEFAFTNNNHSTPLSLISGISYSSNQGGNLNHKIGGDLLNEPSLSDIPNKAIINYNITYLKIPLGLRFKPNYEFGVFYLEFPLFFYERRLNVEGAIQCTDNNSSGIDITHIITPNNFSLGGGFGFHSDYPNFDYGVQFSKSLNDITLNNGIKNDGTIEDSKAKLNNVSVIFRYYF